MSNLGFKLGDMDRSNSVKFEGKN